MGSRGVSIFKWDLLYDFLLQMEGCISGICVEGRGARQRLRCCITLDSAGALSIQQTGLLWSQRHLTARWSSRLPYLLCPLLRLRHLPSAFWQATATEWSKQDHIHFGLPCGCFYHARLTRQSDCGRRLHACYAGLKIIL